MRTLVLLTGLLFSAALLGCGDDEMIPETRRGESAELFGGTLSTYEVRNPDAADPHRIGFTLPMKTVIEAAGEDDDESIVIDFPEEDGFRTFSNHMYIHYMAEGHAPEGVYNVPHFDFHFYRISSDDRDEIDCPETAVPAGRLPKGYIIPGLGEAPDGTCEPDMGVHAIPADAPELNGGAFERTMVFVYHEGRIVAIEPMITRESLAKGESFTMSIPAPTQDEPETLWPAQMEVSFDSLRQEYSFTLTNFRQLEAPVIP